MELKIVKKEIESKNENGKVVGTLESVSDVKKFGLGSRLVLQIDSKYFSLIRNEEELKRLMENISIGDYIEAEVKEHKWVRKQDGKEVTDFWITKIQKIEKVEEKNELLELVKENNRMVKEILACCMK